MREKMFFIVLVLGLCGWGFGAAQFIYHTNKDSQDLSYEDSWLLKNPSGIVIIAGPECSLNRTIEVAHEVGPALILFKPVVYK